MKMPQVKSYTVVLQDCNTMEYVPTNAFFATEAEAMAFGKYSINNPPVDTNGDALVDVGFDGVKTMDREPNAKFEKGQLSQVKGDRRVGLKAVVDLLSKIQRKAREAVRA
jgi:hypothetical protein